jgi:hypothetical integral membrane protein (TIGR02206 family)
VPPADWTHWISPAYSGPPFETFGGRHLTSLLAIALFGAWMLRHKGADEATRRRGRLTLAAMLVVNELAWHAWAAYYGQWTTDRMLPLHLCTVLVWIGAYGLVTLNVTIYEFLYFMGIGGPLQGVLTPDAGEFGLPHFRAVQTLVSHGVLIIAALYLTVVEGMRPTWTSVRRVIGGTLIYMAVVTAINAALGTNYMWTMGKPPVKSLLDVLGPWPVYLVPMILLGVVNVLLLYVPFWWMDRRRVRAVATSPRPGT